MKKLFIIFIFLFISTISYSQNAELVVKQGTELAYRLDVNGKYYDLLATVTQVQPFSFTWRIADSANASGSIHNTSKALKRGTVISNSFTAGDVTLNNSTTSLVLSNKSFRKFTGSTGKPITMQLGSGGDRMSVGTYTSSNDLEIKVNGSPITIKEELVKPLVKVGKKYISTGDEMMTFYNSPDMPIILRIKTTYTMELLSITNK